MLQTEFPELLTCQALLLRTGITPDHPAQLADALRLLAKGQEGHPFSEMGGSELEVLRILSNDAVIVSDSLLLIFLAKGDLAQIELRVRSQVGVAVVLQVVFELRARQVVFAAGDVPQAV